MSATCGYGVGVTAMLCGLLRADGVKVIRIPFNVADGTGVSVGPGVSVGAVVGVFTGVHAGGR